MNYILYNPYASGLIDSNVINKAKEDLKDKFDNLTDINLLELENSNEFYQNLTAEDNCVIVGGDGTLNHLSNDIKDLDIKASFYLYSAGTGNDFIKDVKENYEKEDFFLLNKYITKLPKVVVKDKEYVFVNNVGFGVDGEVCTVADQLKEKGKKINYTTIAIKLVLFSYKTTTATIKVDDKEVIRKKTYFASAFNGRYYGGGMKAAPEQDRLGDEITFVSMHSIGRIRGLMLFSKLFSAEHVKDTKHVDVIKGHKIEVTFDKPTSLQIDGEVIKDVTSFVAYK